MCGGSVFFVYVLPPVACAYTFRDRRAVYAGKTERTGSKNTQTAVGRCGAGAGRAGTLPAGCTTGAGRAEYEKVLFSAGYCGVAHLGCLWQADRPLYRQSCVSSGARPCLCGGYSGAGSAGWCGDCGGIQPKLRQPSAHPAPGWLRDPLRAPAIPLCPPGRGVVQAGQTLGTVGQTGRATGAHLHLELWQQGAACDPAALLETAP